MKTRIERGADGHSTVLHLTDVAQFARSATVRISFIGTTQSLGPNGRQSTPHDINATAVRTDAAVTVPSSFTNHIAPGTPVDISVPAFGYSDQRQWPLLEDAPRKPGPEDDVGLLRLRIAELEGQLKQPSEELERTKSELETTKVALAKALEEIEELKKGTPPRPPGPPGPRKMLIAAALVLGLLVGAAGKYGYDQMAPLPDDDPGALQRKVKQLTDEAFAPLERNVTSVGATSPKGVVPDALASPLSPGRVQEFYNAGAKNAAKGDKPEAVYWFKQAVRLCEPDALAELGDAYFSGGVVTRSHRTGFQLMRCATALGSNSAANKLRRLLEADQVPLGPPSMAPQYGTGQR
jgi:hypothetical protein